MAFIVIVGSGMAALFGVAHHHFVSGNWFDWQDLNHHEPIILAVITLGLGVAIGTVFRRVAGRRNEGE